MSTKLNSIGWAVSLTRCAHLDPDQKNNNPEVYAVNIVLPRAYKKGDWYDGSDGERGPLYLGKDAWVDFQDFLRPWRWNATWWVYGGVKEGDYIEWNKIAEVSSNPGVVALNGGQIVDVRHLLDKELESHTNASEYAFSPDPQDLGERSHDDITGETILTKQSILHALAPITHLPAGLSNAVLRLAGFISVGKDIVNKYAYLTAFPAFDIETSGVIAPTKKKFAPTTTPEKRKKTDRVIQAKYGNFDGTEVGIVFASNSIDRQPPKTLAASLLDPKSTRTLASDVVMPLVAEFLAPSRLLTMAIINATMDVVPTKSDSQTNIEKLFGAAAFDPKTYPKWRAKLWGFLSIGWLPRYKGAKGELREPHVIDFITPRSLVTDVFGQGFPQKPAAPNDTEICSYFCTWAERLTEGPLRSALNTLGKSPEIPSNVTIGKKKEILQQFAEWLAAWRIVAEMGTRPGNLKNVYPALWRYYAVFPGAQTENERDQRWKNFIDKVEEIMVPEINMRLVLGIIDRLNSLALEAFRIVPADLELREAWRANELKSVKAQFTASAGSDLDGLPLNLEEVTTNSFAEFDKVLEAKSSAPTHVPKDSGVEIVFDGEQAGQGSTSYDESIRGFAIALMSGILQLDGKSLWDKARARWITDTAVTCNTKRDLIRTVDGQVAWMAVGIGSSSSAGKRTISSLYEESPLCSVRMTKDGGIEDPDKDFDQTDFLDFRWPISEPNGELPSLGYGQVYMGATTALDNAGGVVDPSLRNKNPKFCTELIAYPFDQPGLELGQYISREAPGAPVMEKPLVPRAYELSAETRAHAFVSSLQPAVPIPKVALLTHNQSLEGGFKLFGPGMELFSSYKFQVCPPGTHSEFIARWLATDCLIREKIDQEGNPTLSALLSDPLFATATLPELIDFRGNTVQQLRKPLASGESPLHYHPAVGAIGIAVWFDGALDMQRPSATTIVAFDRIKKDANGQYVPNKVNLGFEVKWEDVASNTLTGDKLTLKYGSFACLRFYSLVEAKFSEAGSSLCRYGSDLDLDRNGTFLGPAFTDSVGKRYCAFGPLELWFEAAPKWPDDKNTNPYIDEFLKLEVEPPNPEAPERARLVAKGESAVVADWLKGLDVVRDEWHWTGYPVNLPGPGPNPDKPWQDSLVNWLPAFSGVESYRETLMHTFPTRYAEATKVWDLGASGEAAGWTDPIHTLPLADGPRPSRYIAYAAHVIVRFRRWLTTTPRGVDGPCALERVPFAAGGFLRGIARAAGTERLPALALFPPIPLTGTFVAGLVDGLPQPAANGCMLVIMEPLRRTDPATRIGGLGDTVELDIVETKPIKPKAVDAEGVRIASHEEIGPNPIFHPAPQDPEKAKLGLTLSGFFGLTGDQVRNAAVRQTAVVVHPPKNSRQWLMAKVRVRRIILPETLLGGNLAVSNDVGLELPLRIEGGERVPVDFCVDLAEGDTWPTSLKIVAQNSTTSLLDCKIPEPIPTGQRRRMLCSWHRDRWDGGGDATWRVQILAQAADPLTLNWKTLSKKSGYDQEADWNPLQGGNKVLLQVNPAPAEAKCQRVMLSDYTDPFWMTFIGTFGGPLLQRADQYSLKVHSESGHLEFSIEPGGLGEMIPPPTKPDDWDIDPEHPNDVEFHLILLFRPVTPISLGEPDTTAGQLVGVLRPVARGDTPKFSFLGSPPTGFSVKGCYGYLCAFQRISAPSTEERIAIDSWESLIGAMFPDAVPDNGGVAAPESLVRALPKYLGPFCVDDKFP